MLTIEVPVGVGTFWRWFYEMTRVHCLQTNRAIDRYYCMWRRQASLLVDTGVPM